MKTLDTLHPLKRGGFLGANAWNPCISTTRFTQALQFGNALPNWRVRVIPSVEIQGFRTIASKNPVSLLMGVCQVPEDIPEDIQKVINENFFDMI